MPDDPETTLRELRQRIAAEGLPMLSAEALHTYKREKQRGPKLVRPNAAKAPLSLSPEAPACTMRKPVPLGPGNDGDVDQSIVGRLFGHGSITVHGAGKGSQPCTTVLSHWSFVIK